MVRNYPSLWDGAPGEGKGASGARSHARLRLTRGRGGRGSRTVWVSEQAALASTSSGARPCWSRVSLLSMELWNPLSHAPSKNAASQATRAPASWEAVDRPHTHTVRGSSIGPHARGSSARRDAHSKNEHTATNRISLHLSGDTVTIADTANQCGARLQWGAYSAGPCRGGAVAHT